MTGHANFILNRVDPDTAARLQPHLSLVHLRHAQVLVDTHQRVQKVYFPHSGIISNVVQLSNGGSIETGMIGNDGAFGAGQALDDRVSLNRVVIQVPGTASVIESGRLCELALALPELRALLMKYEQFFFAQVQQAVACNAVHNVEKRICKWLLRMHDLVGEDLPLTQEFLAEMMGVRRTSVTEIAGELQKQGLITYRRGHIHISDIDQMREHACECDDAIHSHYRKIFASEQPTSLSKDADYKQQHVT
jgi:CRP-like cAMP-binding protein